MDATKALQAIQVARFRLHQLYLGDQAGDELTVAETPVPAHLAGLAEALYLAQECLTDKYVAWGEQAVEFGADGATRLEQLPICVPAP